jgi:hypothetical protein
MTDVFTPSSTPFTNDKPAEVAVVGNPAPGVIARSHEPSTPAQDRWQADRAAAAKGDPWQGDPSKTMLVRQADGSIIEQSRRDGGVNGEPRGDQPASPGDQQLQPGPDRIKVGDMEFSAEELQGLRERKALEDSRRAQIPQDPSGYQAVLPEDAVLPPGIEVKYSDADPLVQGALKSLREFCHANGLGQREFSQLLAVDANRVAIEKNMLQRAHEDQMRQLGGAGTARLSAVATWLKSMAGEEGGKALIANLLTARQVSAFETMMHRHQSQGGGSYSGAHRDPPQKAGTVSTEQYAKMSYTERKDYAAQFEQR